MWQWSVHVIPQWVNEKKKIISFQRFGQLIHKEKARLWPRLEALWKHINNLLVRSQTRYASWLKEAEEWWGGWAEILLPSHWKQALTLTGDHFVSQKNSCQRTLNLSQWQFITEGVKAKQHNCMKCLCVLDQSKAMGFAKQSPSQRCLPNIINITVYSLCCKKVNKKWS